MSLEASLEELAVQGYTIVRGALCGPQGEVEATRRAVASMSDEARRLLDHGGAPAEEEVARTTGTQTGNLRNAHAIVGKHPHVGDRHEFYLNQDDPGEAVRIVRAVLSMGRGDARVSLPTTATSASPCRRAGGTRPRGSRSTSTARTTRCCPSPAAPIFRWP